MKICYEIIGGRNFGPDPRIDLVVGLKQIDPKTLKKRSNYFFFGKMFIFNKI